MKRPQKTKRAKLIALRMPLELARHLVSLARYRGCSVSALVRRWIRQGVRAELPASIAERLRSRSRTEAHSSGVSSPSGMPCGTAIDSYK
jgi:predicted DNA-binding protein